MKTFVACKAIWTKSQIVKEINDMLDLNYSIPLKEIMITDDQAQDFVNQYYDWLIYSITEPEEVVLQKESDWQTNWYISVTRQFFTEETQGV